MYKSKEVQTVVLHVGLVIIYYGITYLEISVNIHSATAYIYFEISWAVIDH